MGTSAATAEYLAAQMVRAGGVSTRRMFGEYAVYCSGRVVALICDEQLFFKPTDAGRAHIGTPVEGLPYPGAKPWFLVPGERWEDDEWLATLARLTADALPPPKEKRPRTPKAKRPTGKPRRR